MAIEFVARKANKLGLHGAPFSLSVRKMKSPIWGKWGVYLCSKPSDRLGTRSWLLRPEEIDRHNFDRLCDNRLWTDRVPASTDSNMRNRLVRKKDKDR